MKHIRQFRDRYAATPGEENNSLRCLSSFLQWSAESGYRDDNPARGIRKFKLGTYAPWPWHVIEDARANLPDHLWRPVALALYTGQRQSDVLAMRRNAVRDGMITVKQEKTGVLLDIPVHRDLRPLLETIPHDAMTVLATKAGRPWGSGFKIELAEGANAADQTARPGVPTGCAIPRSSHCWKARLHGRDGVRRHRPKSPDRGALRSAGEPAEVGTRCHHDVGEVRNLEQNRTLPEM